MIPAQVKRALLDYWWLLLADDAACTCEPDDVCPVCRCMIAMELVTGRTNRHGDVETRGGWPLGLFAPRRLHDPYAQKEDPTCPDL